MSLPYYRTLVHGYVQDTSGQLDETQLDECLMDAVLRFSRRKPRRVVLSLVSDGSGEAPLADPWTPDFSTAISVEYPLSQQPRAYLPARVWSVVPTPEGDALTLSQDVPPADAELRVLITTPHLIDEASTTVPATDRDTVVLLAAGYGCLRLAAYYSNTDHREISADSVDHGSKSEQFAKRARDLFKLAGEELPTDGRSSSAAAGPAVAAQGGAAGVEVSFAPEMAFLTHRRR